jgi:hypothetical protein
MPVSISGTNGVTFPDSSLQAAAASPFGLKNRIINGDMVIDQRRAGASVSITTGTNIYTLDRWQAQGTSSAGVYTVQRSTIAPSAFINSFLATVTTADASLAAGDLYAIGQFIEGFNVADLGWGTADARTVTLSFWVRSSVTGTFGGSFTNSAFNRSYPFTYTINAANTFEYKTITIAGDTSGTWLTNNGIGIRLYFGLGVGSTFSGTAGAWLGGGVVTATGATNLMATNGATFYITGVQLERNTTATPFEWIPYGQELQLCQRYYEKSYAIGTVSGTATSYPAYGSSFNGMSNTSGQKYVLTPFKVTKRASPNMTYYDAAGTSGRITTLDIGGTNTNNVSLALVFVNDSQHAAAPNNGTHTGLYYDWVADIELA